MSRTIKLTISGKGAGTDAPTVEDALDQIRDYLDILRGVEEAVAGTPTSALDWRLVDASRNSPLAFEIQAFPRQYATNIDQRAEIVTTETARGLAIIQVRPERPPHFTNHVMRKAHRIFERATNGIGVSEADFGKSLPKVHITPTIGRNGARNIDMVLTRPEKPHQELGSIEGYFQGIERGGWDRRVAYVIDRITGETIRCVVSDTLAPELESREIGEVWRYRRVEVRGRIHFSGGGRVDHLAADEFIFLRQRSDLPQIDEIIDPDFTGGIRTEEYLERLRDGTLS
jgi:hypothetical protein